MSLLSMCGYMKWITKVFTPPDILHYFLYGKFVRVVCLDMWNDCDEALIFVKNVQYILTEHCLYVTDSRPAKVKTDNCYLFALCQSN